MMQSMFTQCNDIEAGHKYLATTPETTLSAAFWIFGTNWKCFSTIWKEAEELAGIYYTNIKTIPIEGCRY